MKALMRRPGIQRLLLALLSAALVWLLVQGYADYLARPAPERSLALNAGQPEALVRVAERALLKGAIDEAEGAARRALRKHPFEGRALRVLGAVAERRGDREGAIALMQLAATTTPRDSVAQFWLAINALVDRDLDGALRRLDRLLRFEPESYRKVFPILSVVATNPVGAGPIAAYLAGDPPWRAQFMSRVIGEAESMDTVSRLFRAIETAGGQVHELELDDLAERLLALRDWPRLRRLLASMVATGDTGPVKDAGFDGAGRGPLLGWAIGRKLPGADVLLGVPDGSGNRSLHVAFHDRRVPFREVSQVLLLAPGHYRLSGRARLQDLRTALGLSWNLSCIDRGTSLGKSERLLGSRDWHEFQFEFTVPATDCGGQILLLALDARIAAEQQVSGKAWFDDFRIESIPEPASRGDAI